MFSLFYDILHLNGQPKKTSVPIISLKRVLQCQQVYLLAQPLDAFSYAPPKKSINLDRNNLSRYVLIQKKDIFKRLSK